MRSAALLRGICFSGLVLASGLAQADGYNRGFAGPPPNWIVESNNQISVQYQSIHFDYAETQAGVLLDTEKGWVPGVGVSVTVMQNWMIDNLYFNGSFAWYRGHTDYVGSLIGGVFGSVRQENGAIVRDFDFRLGKGFAVHRDFMVTPFFGIGSHDWDRKVNNGEDYTHGYWGAGLLLQWSPMSRLVVSADGLIGKTFDPNVFVHAIPGFVPDTSLDLGDSRLYKLGLSADYAITRNIHANAGIEYTNFHYGQSPVVNGILEPDSKTENVTFKVGLGYAWGGRDERVPLK
jgi:hypothetical protein